MQNAPNIPLSYHSVYSVISDAIIRIIAIIPSQVVARNMFCGSGTVTVTGALAKNEEVYNELERARSLLIVVIQAVNNAIDADTPYEVVDV